MLTADYRVVQYAPATLTWQPTDQNGELVAATGTPTVTVTRADGTTLVVAAALVAGVVEITFTAAQLATLDILAVSWLLDGVVRGTSTINVVGQGAVTPAEVRRLEPTLGDVAKYSNDRVRAALDVIEATIESVCSVAFTPRLSVYRSVRHGPGSYHHLLPHVKLRRVRFAYTTDDAVRTDIDAGDLGQIAADSAGIVHGYYWAFGVDVTIGYEHGEDRAPADLRAAIALAVRRRLNVPTAGLDPRAMSYSPPEGGNVILATPGLGPWVTGMPEVDEVLKRYNHNLTAVG